MIYIRVRMYVYVYVMCDIHTCTYEYRVMSVYMDFFHPSLQDNLNNRFHKMAVHALFKALNCCSRF